VFISFFLIILFYGTLKQKFQNFVDRRLFSETFRQKQANDEFSDELSKAITANEIGNLSFSYLVETLKTEKLGIIIFDLDTNNVIFSRFSTMIDIPKGFHRSMSKFLKDCSIRVAAKENTIEKGYKLSTTDELLVTIEDMNVYLFSFSNDRSKVALTMFGDNSKHFRYSHEEIDAALFKTDRAISNISRLFIMSHLTMKEEQNKQLEELSDMKSYFISSVTHELKTPLTSIKIFAELMQNSEDISNTDKNKYLEIIQYECSRLNNLINNVLDFSKIERGVKEYNFANIDLVHVIGLVMTMMQFQFERAGFKVEKDITVSNAAVNADKDAVSEVIINLLSNSMKYSDDEKYIKVSLSAQNGNFVLSVEDKGNGIPLEDQKHIFDAFYRAESAKKGPTGGAGIGLSLVKSIIDAHNGDIKLNSIPGEGTKIDIYIPKGENDE